MPATSPSSSAFLSVSLDTGAVIAALSDQADAASDIAYILESQLFTALAKQSNNTVTSPEKLPQRWLDTADSIQNTRNTDQQHSVPTKKV